MGSLSRNTGTSRHNETGNPTARPEHGSAGRDDLADLDDLDLAALHRRHSAKWQRFPPDVLPTWVAEMDYPLAPPVLAAVRAALDRNDLGYTWDKNRPLHEAFAAWADAEYGWTVDPDEVFTLPDVMRGVEVALATFTDPGDQVVVNTPIYPPFLNAVVNAGRGLVENPLVFTDGRYELDLAGLAERFANGARAYLLCNPHNPTGRVLGRDELSQILDLAARHDVLVVSDEIHSPLTHPGAHHVPAATLAEPGGVRLLTVTSPSKAWNVPGLKCAVATASHPKVRDVLHGLPERVLMGAGILGVEAAVAAYTEGGQWLARVRAHLDRNRRLLAELVSERLPGVGYVPPEATYLGWLDCRALGFDDPAAVFAERGRVAVGDGRTFGPPGTGFVRVSFATSRAILTEIVNRMARALE